MGRQRKGIKQPVLGRIEYVKDSTITISWHGSAKDLHRLLNVMENRQDVEITIAPAREEMT